VLDGRGVPVVGAYLVAYDSEKVLDVLRSDRDGKFNPSDTVAKGEHAVIVAPNWRLYSCDLASDEMRLEGEKNIEVAVVGDAAEIAGLGHFVYIPSGQPEKLHADLEGFPLFVADCIMGMELTAIGAWRGPAFLVGALEEGEKGSLILPRHLTTPSMATSLDVVAGNSLEIAALVRRGLFGWVIDESGDTVPHSSLYAKWVCVDPVGGTKALMRRTVKAFDDGAFFLLFEEDTLGEEKSSSSLIDQVGGIESLAIWAESPDGARGGAWHLDRLTGAPKWRLAMKIEPLAQRIIKAETAQGAYVEEFAILRECGVVARGGFEGASLMVDDREKAAPATVVAFGYHPLRVDLLKRSLVTLEESPILTLRLGGALAENRHIVLAVAGAEATEGAVPIGLWSDCCVRGAALVGLGSRDEGMGVLLRLISIRSDVEISGLNPLSKLSVGLSEPNGVRWIRRDFLLNESISVACE